MSLSVKENRLVAVNRLGENTLQTVLQGKVELPSTAAPVERIVWVEGIPVVQSFTTDQDRVYVQGVIDLTMVYVPEILEGDPAGLRRVEWPGALPFDHYVEVIGAEPEMISEVEATILVCEWDLRSGQYSVDVDLIVATTAQVYQKQQYTVIGDANIGNGIKLTTDGLVLNPLTPFLELEVNKEISGILELPEDVPPLQTILDVSAELEVEKREVMAGQVMLKGSATLRVLYEGDDFTVREETFINVLPFELSFEKSKIEAEMRLQERLVTSCEGYVVNDGQGLRAELHVQGVLRLQKRQTVSVLTEISAPGNQVQVRKELIGLDSFVSAKEQQGVVRGLIEIGQQLPPIREILRCRADAYLTDYEVDEDKVVVEGALDVELFYLAHSEEDTKPIYRGMFPEALSFEQAVVVPGLEPGMQPQIKLEVVRIQPDLINRETVEVVATLRFVVNVVEYLEVEVVVEAVAVEPPLENPPTLTYVFVQSGDTVWKLARQYHTTEEVILQANPSLQDNALLLKPGDRLYIPRS